MTNTEAIKEFPIEDRIPLLKAVRLKCLDCSCFQPREVELCPVTKCTLYPYRFGKDPYKKKREYTEDQRTVMRGRAMSALSRAWNSNKQSEASEETTIG